MNIGCSSLYPWTSRNRRVDSWVKGVADRQAVERVYSVPIFRADDLAFLRNQEVLLIVVNVAGAEPAFLRGADALLRQTRYFCLEAGYHLPRDGAAADARQLLEYLAAHGWELMVCSATGRAALSPD